MSRITRQQYRFRLVLAGGAVLIVSTVLILMALNSTITFFYEPSKIQALEEIPNRPIRLGGLVKEGSVSYGDEGEARFTVTDLTADVLVSYKGILPDLFREGQGVVVLGSLQPDKSFVASEVLAKHDENYMPPEVAEALKESGKWQHTEQ